MLYNSYGKLVYEADVLATPTKLSDNWVVLNVCNDLVNYYQYWLNKRGVKIKKSSWRPHLSVIRGETMDKDLYSTWIKNNGGKVYFDYDDTLKTNGKFIWVDCKAPKLNELRKSLGLYLKKDDRFHLTVAKLDKGVVYIGMESLLIWDP